MPFPDRVNPFQQNNNHFVSSSAPSKYNLCQQCRKVIPGKSERGEEKAIQQREIKIASTVEFRQELFKIRESIQTILGKEIIDDIDRCREELISLSEDDGSVLKHQQGFILAIIKSDKTMGVKNLVLSLVGKIKELLKGATDGLSFNYDMHRNMERNETIKNKFNLLLLMCSHYKARFLIKPIKNIISHLDEIKVPEKSDTEYLKRESIFLTEYLPFYLIFDLLLEGSFDKSSRLFSVIRKKLSEDIRVDFNDILRNIKFELDFNFDDSKDAHLIWTLFSLLGYWENKNSGNYRANQYLNAVISALKSKHKIDFSDDQQFISLLCMRAQNTHEIEALFLPSNKGRENFFRHLRNLDQDDSLKYMTITERTAYLMISFNRSNELAAAKTDLSDLGVNTTCLQAYFIQQADRDQLTNLLLQIPVHNENAIQKDIITAEKQFNKNRENHLIALKMQEAEDLAEKLRKQFEAESEEFNLELQQLQQKRKKILSELVCLKSKTQAPSKLDPIITNAITDPITLQVMEKAVFTEHGHTFDRESLTRYFNGKRTARCPLTRQEISIDKLRPNHIIQYMIDACSQETIDQINSGFEQIKNDSINSVPESVPIEH